jgi:peptidoglycan hydrolase-like protein with peptidoglycan-binding domain
MTLPGALRSFVVTLIALCCIASIQPAAAADADALKAEIDTFFHRLQLASAGRLRWDGADSIDASATGDEAFVTIVNARFSLRKEPAEPKPLAIVTLDRLQVRKRPAPSGGDMEELTITFPESSTFVAADGSEFDLTLKDGKATTLLEGAAERQRGMTIAIANGRFDVKDHAVWATFGPIAGDWKIVGNGDGSWRAPTNLEIKKLEFLISDAPLAGAVGRIALNADAGGPNLADYDAFRDRVIEVRDNFRDDPNKQQQALLALLPKGLSVFSYSKGNLAIERVTAKRPDGETLVSLDKAWIGGGITGLDGDKAAWRITLGHDGLTLAPSLLSEDQVPRSADLDVGIEDIAVSTLRTLIEAASQAGPDVPQEERQKASQQILAATMSLQPVFRIYDAMVNFRHVSVDASGAAKRAPPAPIGYTASGDITVRGFDALSGVLNGAFERALLPLLKFIGNPGTDADGLSVMNFAVTSAIGRTIAVNNSNLANWFGGIRTGVPAPGAPVRLLRLSDPPLTGADVRAVQKAVAAQQVEPFTDGIYDTATALAVMRFQKARGLNVDGTVDPKMYDALGLKPPSPPTPPKN